MSMSVFISPGYIPRSWFAGSWDGFMICKIPPVSQGGHTSLFPKGGTFSPGRMTALPDVCGYLSLQ